MEALAGRRPTGRRAARLPAVPAVLAEEIGTEPSDEVRAIEQRIATSWASASVDIPLPSALTSPLPCDRPVVRAATARLRARARSIF